MRNFSLPSISNSALIAIKKGVDEKHSVSNLENLGASQRLINLLEYNGISDLEKLMLQKKEDLLSIPNFGEKQLFILFSALSKYSELETRMI